MGEEKLDVTMTFLLEGALNSALGLSSNDKFVRYILESKFPGVHYDYADDYEKNGMPMIVGSAKATMTPDTLNAEEDPFVEEAEENACKPDVTFHSQSLECLEKNGPFLMKNGKDSEKNCSVLLNMAANVKVLTPPDDPLPWDILNISQWKASLCELIKEMKTVEDKCSPLLIRNPRDVYVLTASPHDAFLRALAAEIADADEKT